MSAMSEAAIEDLGSAAMRAVHMQEIGRLKQLLSERDREIEQLKPLAQAMRLIQRHRSDLADSLIDEATDVAGKLVKFTIDAALGGEDYIPCTWSERGYRFSLIETVYEIKES